MEGVGLDKVIVIPTSLSPFKKETLFAAEQRLELVKLAFAGLPQVVVDDRELRKEGVSYTIDTMRALAAENPGAKFWFITGDDALKNIDKWKDHEELLKLCEFVGYKRTRESSSEVRRRLAAGEPIDDLVPEKVARAIAGFFPCPIAANAEI